MAGDGFDPKRNAPLLADLPAELPMSKTLFYLLVFLMMLSSMPIVYDWFGQSSSPKLDRLVTFAQNVFVGALFALLALLATH